VRVDFYQLGRDPVEAVVPRLAEQTLKAGERLLVLAADPERLAALSRALWAHAPESFLANGVAGTAHDARQPILLSTRAEAANGASFVVLADGAWREEAQAFARVFLLFDTDGVEAARACWRMLGDREAVERRFWKQEGGKWREGP
jgi:DNA polymerase III subunit chi